MMELLTAKDMQALLQVDRSTIYRMAESGRLPGIKVGKQWRFPKQQIDHWLNTNGATPTPSPQPQPQPVTVSQNDFADLFPLQCVQLIQDTFADSLEVMIVVTDINGKPVTTVSNPCGLFSAISDVPQALEKCLESWRQLAQDIDLEPKFSPSHLGLLCARAMIRVGAELKGMVFVGGIAPAAWPPAPEKVDVMATEFGVTPQELQTHIDEVFYLSEAEKTRVLSFVQRIANIVAHIISERNSLMGKLDAIAQLTR
jgi:excisionase family DNA binding protein